MSPITRAILLKLGAVTLFIVMASLVKAASAEVPPGQTVFFRAFWGIPVILVWLVVTGHMKDGLVTQNPMGHFWRGVVGTSAMSMGFAALAFLPLSEVKAIQYAQPVLVVVFAAMFLGEMIRIYRLSAVFLGLTGVMVIMWPRLTAFSDGSMEPVLALGAVLALGSAVMAGLSHVFVRKLTDTEPTSAIVFWFAVTASCLSLLTAPFGWVWPSTAVLWMMIGSGVVGAFGQVMLVASYRGVDVSVVAPFEYASILLALLIGYTVFDEVPTVQMLFGILLIVIAGILIIWRERVRGKTRAKARQAMTRQG